MAVARFSKEFDKEMLKLYVRNPVLASQIERKIEHICANPEHYKPLRGEMKGLRRVHFGSYVLVYRFHGDEVLMVSLDHHDDAY